MFVVPLQYTGGTQWAVATLDSFKEDCRTQLYRNTSLWVLQGAARHPSPPSVIASLLCLNDCSGRGHCDNGKKGCSEETVRRDTKETLRRAAVRKR